MRYTRSRSRRRIYEARKGLLTPSETVSNLDREIDTMQKIMNQSGAGRDDFYTEDEKYLGAIDRAIANLQSAVDSYYNYIEDVNVPLTDYTSGGKTKYTPKYR